MRFQDKVAVIASGGTGAGLACARRFLSEGARVALYGDTEELLKEALELESTYPGRLLAIRIRDYRNREELAAAARQTLKEFGTADILVTAITTKPKRSPKEDEEEYQRILHTILDGALYSIQPYMETLINNRYGRIVLISSLAGRTNIPGASPAYAAAHAGLGGMARNIGCTMGIYTITANCIATGALEDGSYDDCAPGACDGRISGREKGRLSNVAAAVEYLAADLASWTTGETLDLNGGRFMT